MVATQSVPGGYVTTKEHQAKGAQVFYNGLKENLPDICPVGKLSLLYWAVTCPPLCRDTYTFSPKASLHYHYEHPQKGSPKQRSSVPLFTGHFAESQRPMESCVPTIFFLWILFVEPFKLLVLVSSNPKYLLTLRCTHIPLFLPYPVYRCIVKTFFVLFCVTKPTFSNLSKKES